MQEVVYIYEYVLVFFSKSWVCLGIQGHTPGAATGINSGCKDEVEINDKTSETALCCNLISINNFFLNYFVL